MTNRTPISSPIPPLNCGDIQSQKNTDFHGHFVSLLALGPHHAEELWPVVSSPEVVHAPFWTYLHTKPWSRFEAFKAVFDARLESEGIFHIISTTIHRPASQLPSPAEGGASNSAPQRRQAAGWTVLRNISPPDATVDIGIFLPSPSLQKTPVATESIFLLLRHAFEDLGFQTVRWETDSLNVASRRAAERLGFTLLDGAVRTEATGRDSGGVVYDVICYVLRKGEWEAGVRDGVEGWLGEGNFDEEGRQRKALRESIIERRGR